MELRDKQRKVYRHLGANINTASGVAAAGAAVAFYFYSKKLPFCGVAGNPGNGASASEHFEGTYQAPATWMEALYFFAEALRYMYHESLGRWRSSDLLIGLAYLAQQEAANCAAADIAKSGKLVGAGLPENERAQLVRHFRSLAHFMKFCQALRERHMPTQSVVLAKLGISQEDILMQQGFAGMLKPSYVIVRDHKAKCIVLAIRGTHSIKDMFTSLTSATKPHHMVADHKVVLGYSHFGMLAAARWVLQQTESKLRDAMESQPTYRLQIVGHSLGGGTAALLTARLREMGGVFAEATCLAIACPACMTKELAMSCASYTTTIINGHDMIPSLSPGAADALREEVMQSSWYEAFRADLRSSIVVRAVEASLGGVGSVSSWTSAQLSSASRSLRACYSTRRPPSLSTSSAPSASANLAAEANELESEHLMQGVQNAKDWIDPQVEKSSVSWSEVLRTLEPLDIGNKSDASDLRPKDRQDRQESSAASFSGRADVDVRASWPPTAGNSLGSIDSASFTPSKPTLWSRWWPTCNIAKPGVPTMTKLKVDEATQDSNFDSLQPPDTPNMQMARTASEDLWYGNELQDPLSPSAAQDWSTAENPLSDSETEERARETDAVPRKMRRLTFPAGKIYHLLPASLVFGDTEALKRQHRRQDRLKNVRMSSGIALENSQPASDEGVEISIESGEQNLSEGIAFDGVFREGVDSDARPAPGEDPFVVIVTNRAKGKLGVSPPIPPAHDIVLLEEIPQELYGKIRLCKRMLADHFIPVYLGALEVALDYVEHDYYIGQ